MNQKIILSPEVQKRLFRAFAKGYLYTNDFPELFSGRTIDTSALTENEKNQLVDIFLKLEQNNPLMYATD